MKLILAAIHVILILSLLPWFPMFPWFANFLNDAIHSEPRSKFLVLDVTSYLIVLAYPIFVFYGIVSSWILLKRNSDKSVIIRRALSPIMLLLLAVMLFLLPIFISGAIQS